MAKELVKWTQPQFIVYGGVYGEVYGAFCIRSSIKYWNKFVVNGLRTCVLLNDFNSSFLAVYFSVEQLERKGSKKTGEEKMNSQAYQVELKFIIFSKKYVSPASAN